MPLTNPHRSNAEELVAKVPIIEVAGHVALCDGGGGATGHPIEYIKLDKREGHSAATCNYCGLRYKMAAGSHH
jgi:NADH dehydrogenase (ubiquinone) Fe-S protein 6